MSDKPKPPQCCVETAKELFSPTGGPTTDGWYSEAEAAAIIAEQTHMAETIRLLKETHEQLSELGFACLPEEITAHLAKLEGAT